MDHSFVEIEFDFIQITRGKGFWKLNTSFLEEIEYVENVNKIIEMADFRYVELSPTLKWEMIKKM